MNVMLIDDHTLFRESLRRLLEGEPDWTVTGTYGNAEDAAYAIAEGLACDLALIDFDLDGSNEASTNGLTAAARLRSMRPAMPILLVTAGMDATEMLYAVHEAKVGIFLKNEPSEELFLAMRRTARGEQWVSSGVALSLLKGTQPPEKTTEPLFSSRERMVLDYVLEGLTNKEIGSQLQLSESLIKAILQKLFEKTGVRSRSQLVRIALELQAKPDN
ncbi:DNA-binding response regulator, NarL/FixJ family, contains REC and HTH domains [Granulicella pectinivorans]|jgi:DNA-binding NarL/FixJ family response regulator|uniref:DNA-binding response regulator, NarL/FixJ family, contains REC and HTH domains n=1 Tax=Granulicella pectinivorans TaxID=474950 RepID=A0A1I6L1J5_9BACT|nr:response regulator transcription factor [Granulicella pectinivorans]SFR97080.1 DNA-binding response regulator, NarL/FixJ family, contains REC and HTH domains [Granulicella pectinivorans]